ncbi:MAG: DUF1127 domain-containing protein [Acetobacteraceae bacterium]|nr:DUF1127 domain-containing protein [Acetobacteraceae bacterium]
MSAPIAKTTFSLDLPKLSYVNAKWEEPSLTAAQSVAKPRGFAGWLGGLVTAFRAWRERDIALGELSMMTDRELMDIGLTRGDLSRVFSADFRQEMGRRAA